MESQDKYVRLSLYNCPLPFVVMRTVHTVNVTLYQSSILEESLGIQSCYLFLVLKLKLQSQSTLCLLKYLV